MLKSLRTAFITGVLVLLPLGVTVILLYLLLNRIGDPLSHVFFGFIEEETRGQTAVRILLSAASIFIVACLLMALGYASRYVLGRFFIKLTERLISAVPFLKPVYKTVEQVVETISEQQKTVFSKVVLVEFPKKGSFAVGFETNRAKGEVQEKTKADVVNVFIPTTPNPTSGFLIMSPAEEVIDLEMSVGDGMKLIISGGAVTPKWPPQPPVQGPKSIKEA